MRALLPELGDAVRQARYFAAGRVLMDDALLRRAHDLGFGVLERGKRAVAIAAGDRLFDLDDGGPQARAPRLVYFSATRDLARSLLGGFGIGHTVLSTGVS